MPKHYEPCPCGSGRKYKKCHMVSDHVESERHIASQRAQRLAYYKSPEGRRRAKNALTMLLTAATLTGGGK